MDTKLKPIEAPTLTMKLVYLFCKILFGKVLTPLKVAYARLPLSFSLFSQRIGKLDKKLSLPFEQAMLVRHHVAQVNQCTFCMDIGISIVIKGKHYAEKFYIMDEYLTNPMFSERDRTAITFADELTRNKKVSDNTFLKAKQLFSERELVEIAWLVATEHYYNMINLAFDIHSDNLCQIRKK